MAASTSSLQQRLNFNYTVLTSLVLVSWELLVHGFQDLTYLQNIKNLWRQPIIWAYFIQRYGAFIVVVAEANIRLGNPHSCYSAGLVSLIVGGVFVLPSISLIYLFRALAVLHRRVEVRYGLAALWVVVFGASMTAPFSQTTANLPSGGCTITRSERYAPASFIANAVYDSVLFLLTIIKLGANSHQYKNFHSPIRTFLLRDGALYLAISVIVGITDIVFQEVSTSPAVASIVIPLHISLASVTTTRLVNDVFHFAPDPSPPQLDHFPPDVRTGIGSGVGTYYAYNERALEMAARSGTRQTRRQLSSLRGGAGVHIGTQRVIVNDDGDSLSV